VRGVIFDMDGVLIDSMPAHFRAWKLAFKEIAKISVDERTIYLLEGMRGKDLAKSVIDLESHDNNLDLALKVNDRKSEIFKSHSRNAPRPFVGVVELVGGLKCAKAVVSGSAREDVITLLKPFGEETFDVTITADDIEKGKPDPISFVTALNKMMIDKKDAIVVENAPLGVKAANLAGIQSLVVLNNTPLCRQDFRSLVNQNRIFNETRCALKMLNDWCYRKTAHSNSPLVNSQPKNTVTNTNVSIN
jgi:beta-phosphoglucomutase